MTDKIRDQFLAREVYNDLQVGQTFGENDRYVVLDRSNPNSNSGFLGAIIQDTLTGDGIINDITELFDDDIMPAYKSKVANDNHSVHSYQLRETA